MEKETVLAALREHKTRREASDFAPDSGPGGGGESGGEEAEGQAGAGDQWPLLAGPRPRGSQETRDASRRRDGRQPERGAATIQHCHPKVAHLPNPAHPSHMGRALNLKFWQPSCVLVLIRQLAGSGKFKVWSAGPGWWWVPSVPAGSPAEPGEVSSCQQQPSLGSCPHHQLQPPMEACQLTLHPV